MTVKTYIRGSAFNIDALLIRCALNVLIIMLYAHKNQQKIFMSCLF